MHRDDCNPNQLLDLVFDELDEVRAAAMRRHVETCAACKTSLDRLTRGHALARTLAPLEAPPPSETLLAAIRAAAGRPMVPAAAGMDADAEALPPLLPFARSPRKVPAWLRRAGELAMRRQVAMAAVLLLMIGVCLRFYQFPARSTESSELAAPEVIPATELSPESAPAAPATHPAALVAPAHMAQAPAHSAAVVAPTAPMQAARTLGERRGSSLAASQAPAPAHAAPGPSAMRPAATVPSPVASAVPTTAAAPALHEGPNPAPYRTQGQAPSAPYRVTANGADGVLDPSLQRGLPSAPDTGSYLQAGRSNTANTANVPPPPTWQALERSGDDHRVRGERDQAIAAYQQALAQAPEDDGVRRRIAFPLYTLLSNAGRTAEAQQVLRGIRVTPNDTTSLINQLPPAPASSVPHASVAHPARSRAPALQNDNVYNQAGY